MKKSSFSQPLVTLILLATWILFAAACSPVTYETPVTASEEKTAIYGGDKVSSDDPVAKSTVAIYGMKEGAESGALCTGTVIAEDLILTAGHCIIGTGEDHVIIFDKELSEKAYKVRARAALRHEKYNGSLTADNINDIGLIHFKGGLPQGYKPVKILTDYSLVADGDNLIAAGYGVSWVFIKTGGAGRLRKLTLPIRNLKYSDTEIEMNNTMTKGICSGDSGGPTYKIIDGELFLVGVTSRGYGMGIINPCASTSVVTKASSFIDWIELSARIVR